MKWILNALKAVALTAAKRYAMKQMLKAGNWLVKEIPGTIDDEMWRPLKEAIEKDLDRSK